MYPGQYPGWSTPRVLAMLKSGSGCGEGPDLLSRMTSADYFVPEMKNKILLQGTSERIPA